MKGFKDTSKMMQGHHFARGGHSLQPHFGHMSRAPGAGSQADGKIGGTTAHGSNPGTGNSAVMRSPVQPTQQLEEHGGKTPLNGGYKKGGKASHFHVHKHYHSGGKVKSSSKSYLRQVEGAAQMQAESGGNTNANAGFPSGSTGSSRPKLRRGGRTKKAAGGHIHDCTSIIPPNKATGGTINKVATGGTINRLGAGGALDAKGGSTMKKHLATPAPRGHKGMGEMIRRGGK